MRFHHPDPAKLQIFDTGDQYLPWVAWSDDPDWVAISIRRTGVVARFDTKGKAQTWKDEQLRVLPVIQDRSCGKCHACCTPLAIAELDKPAGVPCKHLCGGACGIYDQRPQDCKEYFCAWRLGVGSVEDRPDLCGLLLTPHINRDDVCADLPDVSFIAHEIWPDARQTPRASALMENVIAHGFLVMVMHDDSCELVGVPRLTIPVLRWCHEHRRPAPFGILKQYGVAP